MPSMSNVVVSLSKWRDRAHIISLAANVHSSLFTVKSCPLQWNSGGKLGSIRIRTQERKDFSATILKHKGAHIRAGSIHLINILQRHEVSVSSNNYSTLTDLLHWTAAKFAMREKFRLCCSQDHISKVGTIRFNIGVHKPWSVNWKAIDTLTNRSLFSPVIII